MCAKAGGRMCSLDTFCCLLTQNLICFSFLLKQAIFSRWFVSKHNLCYSST